MDLFEDVDERYGIDEDGLQSEGGVEIPDIICSHF